MKKIALLEAARVRYVVPAFVAVTALASNAGATATVFDATSMDATKTTVEGILGVGVALAIGFAIYKLGKRGTAHL